MNASLPLRFPDSDNSSHGFGNKTPAHLAVPPPSALVFWCHLRYNRVMISVRNISEKLKSVFERHAEIGIVYLFGSQAKGLATGRSDYDFGIYFTDQNPIIRNKVLFDVASEISKEMATDKIDAHSINDIESPELKYQIISQCKIVFEREPHRLILEPRILNEYFDFIYLLRKYNLTKA